MFSMIHVQFFICKHWWYCQPDFIPVFKGSNTATWFTFISTESPSVILLLRSIWNLPLCSELKVWPRYSSQVDTLVTLLIIGPIYSIPTLHYEYVRRITSMQKTDTRSLSGYPLDLLYVFFSPFICHASNITHLDSRVVDSVANCSFLNFSFKI